MPYGKTQSLLHVLQREQFERRYRELMDKIQAALKQGDPAGAEPWILEAAELVRTREEIERLRNAAPEPIVAKGRCNRALNFMDENLDKDIHLPDICAAIKCPERTLEQAFKDLKLPSPMHVLKVKRLSLIRAYLQGHPEASIKLLWMRYHFPNGGSFAKDYRAQYGEPPSETRRRAQREKNFYANF